MYVMLLKKVPTSKDQSDNSINAALFKLTYKVFQEGDVVLQAGRTRTAYIPNQPRPRLSVGTDFFQWELCDGDFFGGGWVTVQLSTH